MINAYMIINHQMSKKSHDMLIYYLYEYFERKDLIGLFKADESFLMSKLRVYLQKLFKNIFLSHVCNFVMFYCVSKLYQNNPIPV